MGKFKIPSECGDVTIEWDPKNPKDVETAKEFFETQKKKGRIIVSIVDDKVKQFEKFEEKLGSMTLLVVPQGAHGC